MILICASSTAAAVGSSGTVHHRVSTVVGVSVLLMISPFSPPWTVHVGLASGRVDLVPPPDRALRPVVAGGAGVAGLPRGVLGLRHLDGHGTLGRGGRHGEVAEGHAVLARDLPESGLDVGRGSEPVDGGGDRDVGAVGERAHDECPFWTVADRPHWTVHSAR